MPTLIEIKEYKCNECRNRYKSLNDAEFCEAKDCFLRWFKEEPKNENEWRDMEPKVRKPTKKWSVWSYYGLRRGW